MNETSATQHTLEVEEDYIDIQIDLTEEELDGLLHGNGFSLEWKVDDGTIGVGVNSPRDFDLAHYGYVEKEPRPWWKNLLPAAVSVSVVTAILYGLLSFIPTRPVVLDGGVAELPPSGLWMWAAIALVGLVTFLVVMFPYLPGKAGGVSR